MGFLTALCYRALAVLLGTFVVWVGLGFLSPEVFETRPSFWVALGAVLVVYGVKIGESFIEVGHNSGGKDDETNDQDDSRASL